MKANQNIQEKEQSQVMQWIRLGCHYEKGAELYNQVGRNESLKKLFPGKEHRYRRKLFYELCKSVGLDWNKPMVKPSVKATAKTVPTPVERKDPEPTAFDYCDDERKDFTNVAGYPPLIRRAILEYTEKFQERSKTHRLMVELGDSNAATVKARRKELFDIVKDCTVRLEVLYKVREDYEQKGIVPEENDIWPKPKEAPQLPVTVEGLKKMKKNLQTSNTKDKNMLDFQTKTKQSSENPMPKGPKRMKIENRMKGRNKKIEEIDYRLNQL